MSVAFITAKKYVNGSIQDVFYLGNIIGDGYVYFNDDDSYRCSLKGENLSILSSVNNKNTWSLTGKLQSLSLFDFSPEGLTSLVGGLIHGSGSVAPNANVEKAVKWAETVVQTRYITYAASYEERQKSLNNVNAEAYDCSSFVITAFTQAGFNSGATYTGDMRSKFTAIGFKWLPGKRWPAESCLRGDILLNEVNHTQIFAGNNTDINCGTTPARPVTHNEYYNYRGAGGWDGILRYEG